MVEISYKLFAGIMIAIIVTSSATYYLRETGSYKNCPGGWVLIESGPDEGKYHCPTKPEIEPQWCHHLSASGYRCYLGTLIEPFESPEIEPAEDGDIRMCFDGIAIIIKSGKEITLSDYLKKPMCRDYPMDLLNFCEYDRYGKEIRCRNILKEEVQEDLRKWYVYKVPKKIKQKIKMKDLTLTSISHPDYQSWVGCKYDFMNHKIVCP